MVFEGMFKPQNMSVRRKQNCNKTRGVFHLITRQPELSDLEVLFPPIPVRTTEGIGSGPQFMRGKCSTHKVKHYTYATFHPYHWPGNINIQILFNRQFGSTDLGRPGAVTAYVYGNVYHRWAVNVDHLSGRSGVSANWCT